MSMVPENKFQQFSIDALQKATDYFNESLNIGKGGYGSVYKGVFDDGSTKTHVAVKGLDPESKQGNKEFETEIKMLSKCRYFHIVKLLGYCNEQNEMILVYEYMSRGALSAHIYRSQESLLTWEQHLKICIGAACGLDYLHTGTGLLDRVIHLDVKCANILIDDTWAAKIADFGLSKIGLANQPYSEVITDHVRGTPGYIDPQYRKNHKFSRKSDVYPFGVVLLEVLSGTRAMTRSMIPDPDNTDLAKWIRHRITNRTLNEVIDPRILSQIHPECLTHFASTISRALHNDPKKQPTMSEVVAQLESALAYQLDMNPSTSIIEDDVFRHFNSPESLNSSETSLHNLSIDNKDSSEHQHVTTESKAEDSIDSEDSAVSSILEFPLHNI